MNTGIVKVDINGQAYNITTSLAEFKALADEIYISDIIPPDDNSYLEPINIPTYDSGDSSHLLLNESSPEWQNSVINDPDIKHIYLQEGSYPGTITLTQSGTEFDRRSISLFNSDPAHPASMDDLYHADVKIVFNGGSYWDIDRLTMKTYQAETDVNWFINGASFNTLNKLLMRNFYYGIIVTHECNNNTIQQCYLDTMTEAGRISDNVGIAISTASNGEGTRVYNTKIIDNDIKNCNDGVHLTRPSSYVDVGYDGTIIDSNRIWIDNTVYYNDAINNGGVLDPNGLWALAENALDMKAGSLDNDNPCIVSNNMFWGFRKNASDYDPGSCFGILYGVKNTLIEKNIMFDAHRGIAINDTGSSQFAADNVTIRNNIFFETNKTPTDFYCNYCYISNDIFFEYNSFIDMEGQYGILFQTNTGGTSYDNNLAIASGSMRHLSGELTAKDNYYYNTTNQINGSGDVTETDPANMTDFTFTYDIFTLNPKDITLTGVISSPSSPHYGLAGSDIT